MHLLRLRTSTQPAIKFGVARWCIGKVLAGALPLMQHQYIQPVFAHVNPNIPVHDSASYRFILLQYTQPNLYASSLLSRAGLQIPFDFWSGFLAVTGLISITNFPFQGVHSLPSRLV